MSYLPRWYLYKGDSSLCSTVQVDTGALFLFGIDHKHPVDTFPIAFLHTAASSETTSAQGAPATHVHGPILTSRCQRRGQRKERGVLETGGVQAKGGWRKFRPGAQRKGALLLVILFEMKGFLFLQVGARWR
jgi:hypothetical protein